MSRIRTSSARSTAVRALAVLALSGLTLAVLTVAGPAAASPAAEAAPVDVAPRLVTKAIDNDSYETQPTALGNRVVFNGFDNSDGYGYEPWITDGTPAGTHRIAAITPHHHSSLGNLTSTGSKVFFTTVITDVSGAPTQLWVTDGSAAGTKLVTTFPKGNEFEQVNHLTAVGGRVFFNVSLQNVYRHLWVSDGTPAGTHEVKAFPDDGRDYTDVSYPMVGLGGRLYFAGYDATHGSELWSSDGTTQGTGLVDDLTPGSGSSDPTDLMAWHGRLFFASTRGVAVSDGTAAGTSALSAGGTVVGGSLGRHAELNGRLFIYGSVGAEQKMIITDGTSAGTTAQSLPAGLQLLTGFSSVGGKVVFGARIISPNDDEELWGTDGTTAGTARVKDIYPGLLPSSPDDFVSVGGRAFFDAQVPNLGRRLFVTDGTDQGTHQVGGPELANPGINSSYVAGMVWFELPDGTYHQPWIWEPGPTYLTWCGLSVAESFGYASRPVATLTVGSSAATTGAQVSLYDGSRRLATVKLSSGRALVRLPASLAVGRHSLRTVLAVQGNLRACSAGATVTIGKAVPTVSAKLAHTGVSHTAHGSLGVTVAARNTTPTGKVTVSIAKAHKTLTATLSGSSHGRHTFALPKLARGTYAITTRYAGSSTVAARSGNSVTLRVS